MSLESRSRMVSFRLTMEEYDRFRQLCFARGLRNVSEMVRAAVNHLLADPGGVGFAHTKGLESRLSDLEERVQLLTLTVERLAGAETEIQDSSSDHHAFHQAASR